MLYSEFLSAMMLNQNLKKLDNVQALSGLLKNSQGVRMLYNQTTTFKPFKSFWTNLDITINVPVQPHIAPLTGYMWFSLPVNWIYVVFLACLFAEREIHLSEEFDTSL